MPGFVREGASPTTPIEQACFWLARRPPREPRRLEGRREVDVAIVGARLTGLWTALFLKQLDPGLEAGVLEREVAAYGASGRNAGILSETLRASFRRHFPALSGLDFPYAWGGAICSTTRLTPFFGRALGGRVHYGLGFTGHGLGTTRLAGRIMTGRGTPQAPGQAGAGILELNALSEHRPW